MREVVNSIRTSSRNRLSQVHDQIAEANEINDNESSDSAVSEESDSQDQSEDKSQNGNGNSDSNYDNDSIDGLNRE